MVLIFLLLFSWSLNAMNGDDNNNDTNDFNTWMSMLEPYAPTQPAEPTIATETGSIPASTTIIIPATVTADAAASTQESAQSNSTTAARSALMRNMRRQAQQVPFPQSQTRWVAPDESVSRSGNYVIRCFYPDCRWGVLYKWPESEEEFRYVQLVCTDNLWLHCHTAHWTLKTIGECVISQFHNPTRAPQKPK